MGIFSQFVRCRVKALGWGHSQNKGPRDGDDSLVQSHILRMSLTHGLLPIIKHEAKGFLHLQVGILSFPSCPWGVGIVPLPICRRKNDGYKVPSAYTTNVLRGWLLLIPYTYKVAPWGRAYIHWETSYVFRDGAILGLGPGGSPYSHRRGACGGAADTLPRNCARARERERESAGAGRRNGARRGATSINPRLQIPVLLSSLKRKSSWLVSKFLFKQFLVANVWLLNFCILLGT